jgi:hypothetical protein
MTWEAKLQVQSVQEVSARSHGLLEIASNYESNGKQTPFCMRFFHVYNVKKLKGLIFVTLMFIL